MRLYFERIQLLIDQARYGLAQQDLEQVLGESPDDPLAHALLAHCLLEQAQLRPALMHAQTAVGLAPDVAFCHYMLALVQQELGHYKAARTSILQALALEPEDPDYLARLGLLYLVESRWQEALQAAEQALSFYPEHIDSLNLRSMALVKLGQAGAAVTNLEHALLHEPDNARVHANRGWTLLHQGEHEQAMAAFREALRLEPGLEWSREGMLEALKSRYLLYRLFQRYHFWMGRFGRTQQFAFLIALLLGVRLVLALASQVSGVLAAGLLALYFGFVALSWLADPLFNLLLRFHPFGRYVLTSHESAGALWTAGLLGGGVVSLVSGLALSFTPLLLSGGASLALVIPTAATFAAPTPRSRRFLGFYTLGLSVCAAVALASLLWGWAPGVLWSGFVFAIGWLAFSWIANWVLLRS
ncbi:MAG: tetratricopeptide repeat protein [Candidatus Sericytochromatia bacterium]